MSDSVQHNFYCFQEGSKKNLAGAGSMRDCLWEAISGVDCIGAH